MSTCHPDLSRVTAKTTKGRIDLQHSDAGRVARGAVRFPIARPVLLGTK